MACINPLRSVVLPRTCVSGGEVTLIIFLSSRLVSASAQQRPRPGRLITLAASPSRAFCCGFGNSAPQVFTSIMSHHRRLVNLVLLQR